MEVSAAADSVFDVHVLLQRFGRLIHWGNGGYIQYFLKTTTEVTAQRNTILP
jgi:uncharacterized protein YqgQ